jgi:UDP-3-O-[3-hydroxymyristoyl] glucosamine N-acyltransferase
MKLQEMTRIQSIRIERDGEFESLGFVSHDKPRMLVYIDSERFIPQFLGNPGVTCVVTRSDWADQVPQEYGLALTEDPRQAFLALHNYLATETDFYWTDFETEISDEAHIHPSAFVAEKNVRVGSGAFIEPGVTVLGRSIIGEDVVLRAGCTIGSHGFEFKRIGDHIFPVVHTGGVLLRNRVEMQSNSNVDRAVFGGFTEIGEDTKVDTLVHVGHNVRIGKRCLIAATTVIAGSTTIGDDVWIGPGVTISSELLIGDRASITLGSVVTKNVLPGQRVAGNYAIEHEKFIAFMRAISW